MCATILWLTLLTIAKHTCALAHGAHGAHFISHRKLSYCYRDTNSRDVRYDALTKVSYYRKTLAHIAHGARGAHSSVSIDVRRDGLTKVSYISEL